MTDDDDGSGKRNRGRWKKGVSGNPNGRPRKKPPLDPSDLIGFLHRELEGTIEITQGGQRVAVPVGQVWAKRILRELLNAKGGDFAKVNNLVLRLLKPKPQAGTFEPFDWTEEQEELLKAIKRASGEEPLDD